MAQGQQMCWQLTNSDANPPISPPLNERGQFLPVGGSTSGWGGPARISLRPAGLGSLEVAWNLTWGCTDSSPGDRMKHKLSPCETLTEACYEFSNES